MEIERRKNEIIIKIPSNIDVSGIERFFDFIKFKETENNLKVSEEVVNDLSSEVNKSIWEDIKVIRNIK